jgi:hypothetical protein
MGDVGIMKLEVINIEFSICKLRNISGVDFDDKFLFIGKTDEELSLVCDSAHVPKDCLERVDGWKAFRIVGILDFSLTGILSKISSILAEKRIGIFAVSTFNTDYILVKKEDLQKAVAALESEGYSFINNVE